MTSKMQAVMFEMEQQLYGVDIYSLQEIIPILRIKPIAKGPAFMEGVINLRGKVMPVVDLRKLLGGKDFGYSFDTRIMVACIESRTIGFIVDGIKEVREFMKDQDVITLDSGQMVQLIALNHLLSNEELEQLSQAKWDPQL
jgi:purine-binding chemotaxis protein CheW